MLFGCKFEIPILIIKVLIFNISGSITIYPTATNNCYPKICYTKQNKGKFWRECNKYQILKGSKTTLPKYYQKKKSTRVGKPIGIIIRDRKAQTVTIQSSIKAWIPKYKMTFEFDVEINNKWYIFISMLSLFLSFFLFFFFFLYQRWLLNTKCYFLCCIKVDLFNIK